MLRIGEFSKMAKTTIGTLRYYDKIGLLEPKHIDEVTGYRYYGEEQLSEIVKILEYKDLGISLEEAQKLLAGEDPFPVLQKRKEAIRAEINSLNKQQRKLKLLMENLSGADAGYVAEIKQIPAYTVFYGVGNICDYSRIHHFISSLTREFREHNPAIGFAEPDYCCAIYPEDSYRTENVMIEYAQAVEQIGVETARIGYKTLEPVTVISVAHRGEDRNLRSAYSYAVSYALRHGYQIVGSARERYINGVWNTASPEEWLTEIQLPVEKEA